MSDVLPFNKSMMMNRRCAIPLELNCRPGKPSAAAIRAKEFLPIVESNCWEQGIIAPVARFTKVVCGNVDGLQYKPVSPLNGFELRFDFVSQVIEYGRFP